MVELRPLRVLQHHALAALLRDDTLVVRQVVGRGLDAAVALPGGEDDVHHADGSHPPELRVAEGGVDGQAVLEPLELRGEAGELRRFQVVADGDEGLEGGLVAEPAVVVGLVGPDRGLERGVLLHPGDVARVVVVRQERRGARLEEGPQRLLGRRGRSLAQELGRPCELALVLDAVGHGHEPALRRATYRGEEGGRGGALRLGKRLHPGLDLGLRGAGGIEVGRLRLRLYPGKEGGLRVELGPRPPVDEEGVQAGLAERGAVGQELEQERIVARPDLAEVEAVEDAGRVDHLHQRAPLALGQRTHIRADVHRREARGHGPQPGLAGHVRPGRISSREAEEKGQEKGGEPSSHGGPQEQPVSARTSASASRRWAAWLAVRPLPFSASTWSPKAPRTRHPRPV